MGLAIGNKCCTNNKATCARFITVSTKKSKEPRCHSWKNPCQHPTCAPRIGATLRPSQPRLSPKVVALWMRQTIHNRFIVQAVIDVNASATMCVPDRCEYVLNVFFYENLFCHSLLFLNRPWELQEQIERSISLRICSLPCSAGCMVGRTSH